MLVLRLLVIVLTISPEALMRSTATMSVIALICLFLCVNTSLVQAQDMNYIFRADTTMDGNEGTIFRVTESGKLGQDIFIYEEDGKYRIYALREDGSAWMVLGAPMFYSPVSSMTIGESWRFIDQNDMTEESLATVVAQEEITTTAGTFACYKIDITVVANPGVVVQTNWLSNGYGLIRESYFEGNGYWFSNLSSYYATGTGFMPRVVGNWWSYAGHLVSTEESSWGAIKKEHQ
jgi:hypothetical protein